jgi:hypothetical protein
MRASLRISVPFLRLFECITAKRKALLDLIQGILRTAITIFYVGDNRISFPLQLAPWSSRIRLQFVIGSASAGIRPAGFDSRWRPTHRAERELPRDVAGVDIHHGQAASAAASRAIRESKHCWISLTFTFDRLRLIGAFDSEINLKNSACHRIFIFGNSEQAGRGFLRSSRRLGCCP